MTIDEAIKHTEEVAEEKESEAQNLEYSKLDWRHEANQCSKCAEEHRQLAEWLKDYKRLLEQQPYDFAKWVASEIFDEWEYNKDTFAEIACRKLEKLGIVRAKGDEWELSEQEPSGDEWEDGYKRAWAEAEVVFEKEPQTGHWIYDRTRDWDGECKYECSECGMGSDVDYDYCMRCGAKMVEPQEISDRNLKMWHDIYEEEKRRTESEDKE